MIKQEVSRQLQYLANPMPNLNRVSGMPFQQVLPQLNMVHPPASQSFGYNPSSFGIEPHVPFLNHQAFGIRAQDAVSVQSSTMTVPPVPLINHFSGVNFYPEMMQRFPAPFAYPGYTNFPFQM